MSARSGPGTTPALFAAVRVAWVASSSLDETASRRTISATLAQTMLAEAGAPGIVLSQRCAKCGGAHGPVQTSPATWRVSVTYAAGWAIVAIAPASAARAIGIDAEPWHDPRRDAAGWRGLLASGASGPVAWTRVEAALKADGRALRVDPALVRVREDDAGWVATVPGCAATIRGIEIAGPEGVAVSLAVQEAAAAASRQATA